MNEINAKHLLSQIQKYQNSIGQTRLQTDIKESVSGISPGANFADKVSIAILKTISQVNESQKISNNMISRFKNLNFVEIVFAEIEKRDKRGYTK